MASNQRVLEQFYDRFGEGDLDAATAMFAVGVQIIDPGLGTVEGLEALRSYLVALKTAVPDARAIVERIFESGDTVIVEGHFTGTGTGPLSERLAGQGLASVKVDLAFADFALIRDDRIIEYRTYYDQVSLLTQLGQRKE